MPHFVVIGRDGMDENAAERRMAARESHINYSDMAAKIGEQIIAAALLDQNEEMRGSVMIVEFDSIEKVQEWLDHEPYVTGDVWKQVDIIPCKIAPSFQHLIMKKA